MGATITVIGSEWISLDNSLPEVQKPCYFLDRENIFRGVMDESGDVYEILDNINNLSLYMNGTSRSSGEKNLHAMNSLFDFVFNQDEYAFPIQKLMEFKKKSNEFWANRIDNLLKYYKDNHVVLMEKDFEYTILMDEPDRNLDIDNIMDLYKVLSFHKPQTQIIAVIHNPALIYKLSKLDCVNFIEMTKGYLKKITGFMNKK